MFLKTDTLLIIKHFKNFGVYLTDLNFPIKLSHDEIVHSEVKQIDMFIQTWV